VALVTTMMLLVLMLFVHGTTAVDVCAGMNAPAASNNMHTDSRTETGNINFMELLKVNHFS
jgi:hypothetical protein